MFTGECFCGKVKYQISGELNTAYYCHCSRCRKLTGASFATNASLDSKLLSITEGGDLLVEFHDGPNCRYHCSQCHSWVYGDSGDYPGLAFIPCGTLNDTSNLQVDHHVFVDSKASWVTIGDNLPQFPAAMPRQQLEG